MSKSTATQPRIDVLPPERARRGDGMDPALEQLADWMDTRFQIPGIGWRFGIDALLGLIPGVGDAVTFFVSCYVLSTAARLGVPRITLARMGLNSILDAVMGCIPFAGDLFDVAWKSNTRNVALLRRTLESTPHELRRSRRSDWLFVIGLMIAVLAVVVVSIAFAWTMVGWLFSSMRVAV